MSGPSDRDRSAGGSVPPAGGDGGAPEDRAATEPEDLQDEVDEVVEGELVEPSDAAQAEADALLAEALDAADIEAQFSAAEADAAAAATGRGGLADPVAVLTADLQRVHAEYSNYRKRVERDRDLVRERAVEAVLADLLPVLDDLGRAEEHGELVGGFKAVGEALRATLAKHGLSPFGAVGEAFDPTRHEALMREEQEGVDEPTVVRILQVGYEMRGRVVRPARVSVAGTD